MTTKFELCEIQPFIAETLRTRVLLFVDGINDTNDGRTWTCNAEGARRVIEEFHRHQKNIPGDVNHLSVFGDRREDGEATGWIERPGGLEWVPGEGLYATIEWLPEYAQKIRDKKWRYVSPGFGTTDETDPPLIVRLDHVALTNRPAMRHVKELTSHRANERKEQFMEGFLKVLRDALKPHATIADTADESTVVAAFKDVLSKVSLVDAAIASHVRGKLNLATNATKDQVATALDKGLSHADFVPMSVHNETTARLATLETTEKKRRANELFEMANNAGKIPPKNEEFKKWVQDLAQNEEQFMGWYKTAPTLAPVGQTNAPPIPTNTATNEDTLIADAMKEHGGNERKAFSALQSRLIKEREDQGFTRAAAAEQLTKEYRKIFG